MADLKYKREDEIGLTLKAFNTVKDKLKHANELMEEYKDTTEKLKLEEENKKNFAKQLYVEKRNNEAISAEAKRDGLTGLFNRRTFDEIVDEFVRHKDESGAEGALAVVILHGQGVWPGKIDAVQQSVLVFVLALRLRPCEHILSVGFLFDNYHGITLNIHYDGCVSGRFLLAFGLCKLLDQGAFVLNAKEMQPAGVT